MRQRILGQSEITISELSLGCMSLPIEKQQASYVLDAALDAGINYFDTADLYHQGINEEIVGAVLRPRRQDIVIATKVGNRLIEGQDGWSWDASPSYIRAAVKNSLQRLQTDYIDVYQLHGGTTDDQWPEIIAVFEELQQEGLIREYGISSIRPNVFLPFAKNSHGISNMMQFNLLDQRAAEWFEALEKEGVSVVTRGSIAKGLLTAQWRERLQDYMSYDKLQLEKIIHTIEQTYGDVHAAALAFNLHFQNVASTVIGARTKEQLKQNLEAYEKAQQLEDIEKILSFTKQQFYTEHR